MVSILKNKIHQSEKWLWISFIETIANDMTKWYIKIKLYNGKVDVC